MLIRCPACEHARTVAADKVPARAEFATCPKCGHRFRFRALAPDEETPAASAPNIHKDIWDAVDSLQERWQGKEAPREDKPEEKERRRDAPPRREREEEDREERPVRDLGRLEERETPPDEEDRDEETQDQDWGEPSPVPWEQPRELGYLTSFYHTMLMALLSPARFFSSLTPAMPLTPALFFYVLFGMFQYVFDTLWLQITLRMVGPETLANIPPAMLQATDVSRIPTALLVSPFLLALYLLITVWLVHLTMRFMAPGRAHFALTFKVAAYAASALVLTAVPFLGPLLGPFGYFTTLIVGCRYAYGLSWGKAFFGLFPLGLLVLLLTASQYMPGH